MKDDLADTYLTHTATSEKKDWAPGIAILNNSLFRIIPDLMLDIVQQFFKIVKQSWSSRGIFSKMDLHKMSHIPLRQNTC